MSSSGIDPVMLELFSAEADMHLPALNEGLLALEKGGAGKKEIESMMRAAHSIKGAARIVGNEPAVRIAHVLEDCFTAAKEGRITLQSNSVDVLLQGVDVLQRTCSPGQDPELTEERMQSLLQQISAVQQGKAAPAEKAPSTSTAVESATVLAAPQPAAADLIVFPALLDDSAAESLRTRFCDILELRPDTVRIDFGEVMHLSALGLSLLLSIAGEAKGLQPTPVIEARRVAPAVRALFRVVGLESAFSFQ